jgi:Cytochrome P460
MLSRGLLVCSLLGLAGCGGNDDPDGARVLWDRFHPEYHSYERAPGYPGKVASSSPHGDQVEIYVNSIVSSALAAHQPLSAWPQGSLIVKDGFKGGSFHVVAVMEKRPTGWYWAEYEPDGTVNYSSQPSVCTDCHASGSDYVRAFALPK